ncbi:MAG: hypothetical protein HKN69_12460 [Desulfofustis sp.]|nr:hypothetical protein [Desulfofustis sp.]
MTQRLTKDQIIERFRRKMIGALEGSIGIQEVCGLSIESLQTDLLAERHRLLKQYGYTAMSDPTRKPALNEKKCK